MAKGESTNRLPTIWKMPKPRGGAVSAILRKPECGINRVQAYYRPSDVDFRLLLETLRIASIWFARGVLSRWLIFAALSLIGLWTGLCIQNVPNCTVLAASCSLL